MTLLSYTRDDLVQGLLDHFGLANKTSVTDVLIRALDEAVVQFCRKRSSWHFLERPFALDVPAYKTGTATFTNSSTTAVKVTGDVPADFDVIADESTPLFAAAYRVVGYSAPNIILDAKYTGVTGLKNFVAVRKWHQLPANFMSMDGPVWEVSNRFGPLSYLSPPRFEDYVRAWGGSPGYASHYTVVADPRAENEPQITERYKYLVTYPHLIDQTTLRGKYQVIPPKLESASSVPIIPIEYRPVLMEAARWITALRLRYDGNIVAGYKAQFDTSMDDLLKKYQFSDDVDDYPSGMVNNLNLPIEGAPSIGDNFDDFV